jgi:hypothetical protein
VGESAVEVGPAALFLGCVGGVVAQVDQRMDPLVPEAVGLRVTLTPRGHEAVAATRRAREALEDRLRQRFGAPALDAARTLLADLLDTLGGAAAVRRREVRPPR